MKPKPNWQPIKELPTFSYIVDGMLEAAEDVYQNLLKAKNKPYVLDDYTISRTTKVHREQLNNLWLYKEQFSQWQKLPLDTDKQQEISRLIKQIVKLKEINEAILSIVDKLKNGTINKILEMDDSKLGLKFLLGGHWSD